MRRRVFGAVLIALVCLSQAAADTKTVQTSPGLIELRIAAPAGADVSWEAKQPFDLTFKTFEGSSVAVFCWHKSGTVVLSSDVIDWDARKRDKTTWIVNVDGDSPDPPDPDPDPGPGPDPDPDPDPTPPPNVPNKYGIGAASYRAAKQLNLASESAKLGAAFYDAAKKLHEARITTAAAQDEVIAARAQLSPRWSAWETAVEPLFRAAVEANGSGTLHYRDYFLEVSKSLTEAAK